MTLQELYDALAALVEEMGTFLKEHEDENGNLSTQDAAIFDSMDEKAQKLKKQIINLEKAQELRGNLDRHKKISEIDDYLSQPTSQPILMNPNYNPFNDNLQSPTNNGGFTPLTNNIRTTNNEYRRDMLSAIRSNFRQVSAYLNRSEDQNGAFLVPTEWNQEIVNKLSEDNILRTIGKVISTTSEHKINIVATKPSASWLDEGEALNFSSETFNQISLDAYKVSVGITASNEILADAAYPLEDFLISELVAATAVAEEDAFINGKPNEKRPVGFLTTLAAEPSAIVTTTGTGITADDILNLVYKLDRPYRKSAVFLANDATVAILRKLKDSTQNFIWTPGLGEEPEKLFGFKIYTSPFMPTAASGNFALAFGNFKDYFVIAERGQRTIQALRELYALRDISAFIVRSRVDAALTNTDAIKLLKVK